MPNEKPGATPRLKDLYLYAQFDRYGPMDAGKFAKEKFRYFFDGSAQKADAVFDAIKESHKIMVVYSSSHATDFQVLHHFGMMSENACKAARAIFDCNGNAAMHEGKLIAYKLQPRFEDDGPGSNMGFNHDASIERTIRCIEEGRRKKHSDPASQFVIFDLSEIGVAELVGLKARISAARRQLPTAERIQKIGMTDHMLQAWVQAGKNLGIPADLIEKNLARTTRAQLKRAQKPQPRIASAA